MNTRPRSRAPMTLSLLCAMLSPRFTVRRVEASTPSEANKVTRFLNNPLIFPDDPEG